MTDTISFRGSIKSYTSDRKRVLIYSHVTGRSNWVDVSIIKKMEPSGLATMFYMSQQIACEAGLYG